MKQCSDVWMRAACSGTAWERPHMADLHHTQYTQSGEQESCLKRRLWCLPCSSAVQQRLINSFYNLDDRHWHWYISLSVTKIFSRTGGAGQQLLHLPWTTIFNLPYHFLPSVPKHSIAILALRLPEPFWCPSYLLCLPCKYQSSRQSYLLKVLSRFFVMSADSAGLTLLLQW